MTPCFKAVVNMEDKHPLNLDKFQLCLTALKLSIIFKGRSGVYKEKLTSVLALSDMHSSCEDLQELLRLISYLIGLFNVL